MAKSLGGKLIGLTIWDPKADRFQPFRPAFIYAIVIGIAAGVQIPYDVIFPAWPAVSGLVFFLKDQQYEQVCFSPVCRCHWFWPSAACRHYHGCIAADGDGFVRSGQSLQNRIFRLQSLSHEFRFSFHMTTRVAIT